MGTRRRMCNEDTDSKLICDTKSNAHVEGTESTKNEDDYNAPPMQVQMLKWGVVRSS